MHSARLGFHGLADDDVQQIVVDEVGQSLPSVTRSGGPITIVPDNSPFPRPGQEPYINSPVPEAMRVAERLRAGAAEQTRDFASVDSFLAALMECGQLIESPS